jgi:methylisocitrate lyase
MAESTLTTGSRDTPGDRLRRSVAAEQPLQVAGVINAYCAMLAQRAGFQALYLSGAGVANASLGIPDLGLTRLDDVAEDLRRIAGATDLPLLVDADTGWGGPRQIARTTWRLIDSGAAGMHLEDQDSDKRCGHRTGKVLVSADEMVDRIRAAVEARGRDAFVIMARTDAVSVEGLDAALDRAARYVAVGADMIFAEALESPEQCRRFTAAIDVPVLVNMTEFGRTPLFTLEELRAMGVGLVLYPLSAFRAMSAAAARVYEMIREQGTQREVLSSMQTREELYDVLDYEALERNIDARRRSQS